MIVYFAVIGDHQLLIESGHRLRTSGDIENRQPSMSKKDSGILIDPGAFAIRTTMRQRVDHPMQNCAFSGSYKSSNTAHGRLAFTVQRSSFSVQRSAFQRSAGAKLAGDCLSTLEVRRPALPFCLVFQQNRAQGKIPIFIL